MTDIRQRIWELRYRAPEFSECSPSATLERVAGALAAPEKHPDVWRKKFHAVLDDNLFLPGGRILANAGRQCGTTLANCFVAGTLEDSLDSVFSALRDCAMTLQAGGGIGVDFSPLHPEGWSAEQRLETASGPVSFLHLWNQMSNTLMHSSPRHGAMMGVLDCSHPDILAFIRAKQNPKSLRHFNLSVAVTDNFMQALANGADWDLQFAGKTVATLPAKVLWNTLISSNQQNGEPGVLFIDRINAANRLHDLETIRAANPCGELPLPPHGSCLLGSLVVSSFVERPFSGEARINWSRLEESTRTAVRMMDNAVDLAQLPLKQQEQLAQRSRRIGLGITGLADALILLGLPYDSQEARDEGVKIVSTIRHAAYLSSCELAAEKGQFPDFNASHWLNNPNTSALPQQLTQSIRKRGLRNSHLTAIAPAGSISLFAGNVSSGIEPVFDWRYARQLEVSGAVETMELTDIAVKQWQALNGKMPLPPAFTRSRDISPSAQIEMIAAIQPFIDSAISKTLNLPADSSLADIDACYQQAYRSGLKGITCYPATGPRGCVLQSSTLPAG